MKKTVKTMALIALMGLVATGCQKEEMVEPQNTVADITFKTVYYTVDGVEARASFVNESSWTQFLDWMFALAKEGHRVSFRNANHERRATKETVTYVTTDAGDAQTWAVKMMHEGYEVTITYNDKTQEYTCIAIK
ncbi:MAG: hypothetical protein ACSW8I_06235 [bacterium]